MPHVRVHSRKQVHTRLSAKNRTQRLTRRNRGPSLPRPQHGLVPSAKFLLVLHAFIYIHFPVHCEPSTPAEEKNLSKLPSQTLSQTIFHRVFQLLSQMAHVCFHRRKWVHTRLSEKDRTQRHTRRKRGAFRMGPQSLPSTRTARSRTSPGRVLKRQTLPLLGLGRGCSQRTQRAFGTAMRLCASLSRGVAAPLGCVIFSVSVEIAACMPCAQGLFVCARRRVVSLPSARFTCC